MSMPMSTPINQLSGAQAPHQFVNEAQRQMITNAQAAVQNYQMPQLSENVMLAEDDAMVNEVLNQYNQGSQPMTAADPPVQIIQAPPPLPSGAPAAIPSYNYADMDVAQYDIETKIPHVPAHATAPLLDRNVKIAIAVAAFYIALAFIPVERLVRRYVAFEKIPYANVLVRALLIAGFVYFASTLNL